MHQRLVTLSVQLGVDSSTPGAKSEETIMVTLANLDMFAQEHTKK